jgi:hypothetical protein
VEIACAMGVPPNEHTSALFQRVARAMKTLHEWEGPKDVKSDSIQEGVKGVNRKGYARKGDPHTLILAAYNPEPAPAQGFAWSVPGVPDPLV